MKHTARNIDNFFSVPFIGALFVILFLGTSCSTKKIGDEQIQNQKTAGDGSAVSSTDLGGPSAVSSAPLQTIYFNYDDYTIDEQNSEKIKHTADFLKKNKSKIVQIEGHCDERGSIEYNLALGEKRARAVLNFLTDLGVKKAQMSIISYGEERPDDAGHSEQAWAKNRRAKFAEIK